MSHDHVFLHKRLYADILSNLKLIIGKSGASMMGFLFLEVNFKVSNEIMLKNCIVP